MSSEKTQFIISTIVFIITLILIVLGIIFKTGPLKWSWYFLMGSLSLFWLYRLIKDRKDYIKTKE